MNDRLEDKSTEKDNLEEEKDILVLENKMSSKRAANIKFKFQLCFVIDPLVIKIHSKFAELPECVMCAIGPRSMLPVSLVFHTIVT